MFRLGPANKKQRGFTLIELLVAMAITGLITSGLAVAISQIFGGNAQNSSEMLVMRQVQDAGHWISRDVLEAQAVTTSESPVVSWEQHTEGLEATDAFYLAFSGDGGSTWSDNYDALASTSYTIPDEYLTDNFKMRFFLDGNSTDDDVYLDNISISLGIFSDDCSTFANWVINGTNWTIYSPSPGAFEFHGEGSGTVDNRTLTLGSSLDLSSYQGSSSGFPLTLTWTGWDDTVYTVEYSLTGSEIWRKYYVGGTLSAQTSIAQYIDASQTTCNFDDADNVLMLTVTASIGGYRPAAETRTYEVTPRPNQ